MKKLPQILAIPALAALILSSAADAASAVVRFSGCVRPGVEHNCLIVHSGQVLFNVTAAHPRPPLNRGISGYGTRWAGPTTCMQGVALSNIHWQLIRLQCPPLPLPAAHRP
jgi:hypothetical protein